MMTGIILNVKVKQGFSMANSQAEKSLNHARILEFAAARFRQDGVNGVSVADLMKGVGMTHGGFYRHFASRDELVSEAVECAFGDGKLALDRLASIEQASAEAFDKLVDGYLNKAHRDELSTSCALTTLAGDVARSGEGTRAVYARQVETYLDRLSALMTGKEDKEKRLSAIGLLSMLVGSLSMARAVNDENLSEEILRVAAEQAKIHFRD